MSYANLTLLEQALSQKGFNLFGITDVETYDSKVKPQNRISSYYPEIKTVIVFGSGGRYFWSKMLEFKETLSGTFLKETSAPIDEYTLYISNELKKMFPELIKEIVFPFSSENLLTDFTTLAVNSGLGYFSPYLRLVLHPVFGSWISLRGAFLSDIELPLTGELKNFNPCTNCHKPCLSACPVKAVTEDDFNFNLCFKHRNTETDCIDFCHIRKACVIGPEHIYSEEEGIHRNKSSLMTLRKYFG